MGYVLEIHQNNEVYTVEVGQLNVVISADSGSSVQSDLAAHKNATNPHNITPAGIGALSKVEHDSSLNGDGTTVSPLSVAPVYAEVTTQADVASVDITQDINGNPFSVKNGETIEIITSVNAWADAGKDRFYIRVNNITTNVYSYQASLSSSFFTFGTNYAGGAFTFRMNLINNRLYAYTFNNNMVDASWFTSNVYALQLLTDITEITSLTLFVNYERSNIPAGTRIIVKKY